MEAPGPDVGPTTVALDLLPGGAGVEGVGDEPGAQRVAGVVAVEASGGRCPLDDLGAPSRVIGSSSQSWRSRRMNTGSSSRGSCPKRSAQAERRSASATAGQRRELGFRAAPTISPFPNWSFLACRTLHLDAPIDDANVGPCHGDELGTSERAPVEIEDEREVANVGDVRAADLVGEAGAVLGVGEPRQAIGHGNLSEARRWRWRCGRSS